jgi:hypothetical protein
MNLVTRMEAEGVPKRIDKGYLNNMAGGVQGQLWAALRSLDLMKEDREPTAALRALVQEGDERPTLIAALLESRYSWALALGTDATNDQLVEAFREHGPRLSASTREKAISFFLQAANYAGVPLSRFFRPSVASATGPQPARSRAPRRPQNKGTSQTPKVTPPATPLPVTMDDMKKQYFGVLLEKAQSSETPDAELLNRIERLLGMSAEAEGKGGGA